MKDKNQLETKTIHISGMFCTHCEEKVRKALMALPGVEDAQVSYENSTAVIRFQPGTVDDAAIRTSIESAGYEMASEDKSLSVILPILVILIALWVIMREMGWDQVFNLFPRVETTVSLGALFVTGLLTSVHCIAMCGGINLTQSVLSASAKQRILHSNLLYQAGRVISYTMVGALAGAIGQVLSFSGRLKGIVAIIAGIFMLIMGLNMLGVFKPLRKLNLSFSGKLYSKAAGRFRTGSSFIIGLLNGLMPCGPLQSMQLYALSTGNVLRGALSMFFFSLGTVPLMLGFGLISGKLNRKYTKVMLTVSALLIFVMGLNMIGNGLSLSGVAVSDGGTGQAVMAMQSDDVQILRTEIDYGSYPAVSVRAGVPVEWTIVVPEGKLTGCNGEIIIPAMGVDVVLHEGDNLVTFTADAPGTIPYSCWMGMIRSTIEVTD